MQWIFTAFPLVMIAIGVFIFWFYGVYVKRKEVGRGMDSPEKRIALYVAVGCGAMFIGLGVVFLLLELAT